MPFGVGKREASPLGAHRSSLTVWNGGASRCYSSLSGRYSESTSSVQGGAGMAGSGGGGATPHASGSETVKPKRAWFDEYLSSGAESDAAKRKMRSRSANARAAMAVRGGRFSSATSSDENDEPTHLTMDEIRTLLSSSRAAPDAGRPELTGAADDTKQSGGTATRKARLERKASLKTVTAHTSFVIMRKPQPVKIFDAATIAPQPAAPPSPASPSSTTQLRSITPLSLLFRDRPPRASASAAACATPASSRRFALAAPPDADAGAGLASESDKALKRTRPESAPPSECYKIVRPAPDTPASAVCSVTPTIRETVRIADDPVQAQAKANTLPTRLNYVLLVNDDAAHRTKTECAPPDDADVDTSVPPPPTPLSGPEDAQNAAVSPPKRTFTQKLRRFFSISKTPPVPHSNATDGPETRHIELADATADRNAARCVGPLATHSHTAFRPVQPRARPSASGTTCARSANAPSTDDGSGSRDSSIRRPDDRPAASNALSSAAASPERASQNRSGFLNNLTQLRQRGWYWGPLTSEQAEWLLAEKEDGSFLVRDSSHDMYILSLSFRSNGITGHVRIEHQGGKFRFTSEPASYHAASSIVEFIEKAMEYSRSGRFQYFVQATAPGQPPLPVTLLRPVSRFETVARLQHLCRFEILKHTRCDHVDALPLPTSLKEYLKQKQFYVDTSTLPGDPNASASANANANVASSPTVLPTNTTNNARTGNPNV